MDQAVVETLLKKATDNPAATFRPGQWEAIDALVNRRRRLMVVQRTGWGKSLVYFLGTRILRDRGAGPTLIISPLLALMRNQIEAAGRIGIRAVTINSSNQSDWDVIRREIRSDKTDAVIVSPERLANEAFLERVLLPVAVRVGMFVVDEAHCISDWGHDFRPDYRRLAGILRQLPPNIPLLCTTATANDRVTADVCALLGDIDLQRGSLVRESLILQTLPMPDLTKRLAWLAHYIPKLPGTGIVYTLTKDYAERVAGWLNAQGIVSRAYYSGVTNPSFADSNAYRRHLEDELLHNRVKVLVATTALGMGYDKPDLGFVIHFQAPSSVISYYQQVGRAGRGISTAYGVLMRGQEDEEIHAYFRRSAFPNSRTVGALLSTLAKHEALSAEELATALNLHKEQIERALKVLSVENPAPVIEDGRKWRRTSVAYQLDEAKLDRLSGQRQLEWQEVQSYIGSQTCLMSFLQTALDDPQPMPCGRCAVCRGRPIIHEQLDPEQIEAARQFLRRSEILFIPITDIPTGALREYGFEGRIQDGLQAQEGRILCRWNDSSWGKMVADDKHRGYFREELVEALAEMIEKRWRSASVAQWVTCVPSTRHPELVPAFARRLAMQLKLPFFDAIRQVREHEPQKMQQNSVRQCRNLDGVFAVVTDVPASPVLLVDDMIDSGWTMTILAILLRQAGAGTVFPVALASTASQT